MLQIYFMEGKKKKRNSLQMSYVPFDPISFTQQFSFSAL